MAMEPRVSQAKLLAVPSHQVGFQGGIMLELTAQGLSRDVILRHTSYHHDSVQAAHRLILTNEHDTSFAAC